MNNFRKFIISTAVIAVLFMPFAYQASAAAPGPKVSELSSAGKGNKHNLSAKAWPSGTTTYPNSDNYLATDNPNTYKAFYDPTGNPKGLQICIFCHTPHSANVEGGAPLWNRRFSTETFSRYTAQSTWLAIRHDSAAASAAQYGQPDGASKLCLSCHDGSIDAGHQLGDVLVGGPIAMSGATNITGIASFNPSNNKMKIGHHPVSFVYNQAVRDRIELFGKSNAWKWPIDPSVSAYVKLDKNSKMQCTTCHNPHQNKSHDDVCYTGTGALPIIPCDIANTRKVAPFWVSNTGSDAPSDRDKACEGCHPVGGDPWIAPAQPWPSP